MKVRDDQLAPGVYGRGRIVRLPPSQGFMMRSQGVTTASLLRIVREVSHLLLTWWAAALRLVRAPTSIGAVLVSDPIWVSNARFKGPS